MVLISSIAAALVGFFVGGLLNVLADDLPDYNVPKLPRYPDGTPRPVTAWLGTAAFLFGERCSPNDNQACLSWRYPLTEIATALAFGITIWRIEAINDGASIIPQTVNGTQMVFWLFYVAVFILITVIDIEHRLILFIVIIPASIIALIDIFLTPSPPPAVIPWWMASAEPNLRRGLIGAAVGFTTFFLFYLGGFVYQRVSAELRGWAPEEIPFGYGDVMLITFCGLVLGWRSLIFAMFITVFLGAAGALFFMAMQKLRRGQGGMFVAIPYGPYIVAGALIMLLFSNQVQRLMTLTIYG